MEYLNEDLANVEDITPFLKQCVSKGKEIPTGSLLQIQEIKNISFPTYEKPTYNSDKHTLKLTVTDGTNQGNALVPDGCPGIDLNTPPGTKIRITQSVPLQGSSLILSRNNCEVLGGRVPKLVEKWEQQKKHAIKHEWGYTGTCIEGEGPPPWRPFGYKPTIDVAALRKMKTTDVANQKDTKGGGEKTQFDVQREEAITELAAAANKQKFQKPNKHLLDKEITDIMDEGFPQADAEYAMGRFKNFQKALKFLKDAKTRQDGGAREPPKPPPERKDRRRKGKGRDDEEDDAEVPAEYKRPTNNISLFGFIEGQIKTDSKTTASSVQSNGPGQHYGGGRDRDLEDGMGRLNFRDKNDSYRGRGSDRGRGRGRGRGGDRGYHSHNSQRYDSSNHFDASKYEKYDSGGGSRYDSSNSQRYDRFDSGSQRYDSNNSQRYEKGGYDKGGYDKPSYDKGGYDKPSYDKGGYEKPGYEKTGYNKGGYEKPGYDKGGYGKSGYDKADSQLAKTETQRPPRFQNRGGGDGPSDYYGGSSRNQPSSGGGHDSYNRQNEWSQQNTYDSRSYQDNSSRQDYSGSSYQYQQRQPASGKDRSYSSEYNSQQYSKSNDYSVPSQTYQQQSYHQQQQQQPSQQRHYGNMSSQNNDPIGYRGGSGGGVSQRPPQQSHFSNQSGGGGSSHMSSQQNPPGEFGRYQYGYEGYNPNQTMVFTRSKPENKGRGGGGGGYQSQGNDRATTAQSNTYGRPNPNSRY